MMVRLASVRVSGGGGDAGVYFFSSCSLLVEDRRRRTALVGISVKFFDHDWIMIGHVRSYNRPGTRYLQVHHLFGACIFNILRSTLVSRVTYMYRACLEQITD